MIVGESIVRDELDELEELESFLSLGKECSDEATSLRVVMS